MAPQPTSYWTAVANIIATRPYGPGGAETRLGTKHFAPGAKVYVIDWYAGMCERITVVGQHRKSKQFITLVIDVKMIENLRAKVCYQPAVLAKIEAYYAASYAPSRISGLTQEFAERMCQILPTWQAQPWRHPAPAVPADIAISSPLQASAQAPTGDPSPQPTPRPAPPAFFGGILRAIRLWLKSAQ